MLSVIVPVYNVAQYLERCVDSICSQTYPDMEIILVDDGSTDGCMEICEKYRQKDPRIVVIHKENGGIVSARKAGICAAKGMFVGWVDGDDWIEEDYFEQMVEMQNISGADIIAAEHYHDIGHNREKILNYIPPGCYAKEDILPKVIYSGEFFEYGLQPHLWNKLIRRSIMKSAEMRIDNAISIGEDVAAVYTGIMEAEKICVTDICAYHYVQHADSMTKKNKKAGQIKLPALLNSLRSAWGYGNPEYKLDSQLLQYEKSYYLLHRFSVFEKSKFPPYGKIPEGSRIIIYGAGGMGRSLYQYYTDRNTARIIAWVDLNWKNYADFEYAIRPPECIRELDNTYDFILIANTRKKIAFQIQDYLKSMGIHEKHIRWLTTEFIQNPDTDWT